MQFMDWRLVNKVNKRLYELNDEVYELDFVK